MKRPRGIIFDLDGTLLDTLASLASAFNRALIELNHPVHPVNEYRHIIGDGARTAALRALPLGSRHDSEVEKCLQLFREDYDESWYEATIYKDITNTLRKLKGQLPLAVLSNKDDLFTQKCIEHFFPNRFTVVVGSSSTILHKPDPSGALHIAARLGTTTDQLWMIGDTSTDMLTAQLSGMVGVGVLWGFREREELENNGANHILGSPSELLELYNAYKMNG